MDLEPDALLALQTKTHIIFQIAKTDDANDTLDVLGIFAESIGILKESGMDLKRRGSHKRQYII